MYSSAFYSSTNEFAVHQTHSAAVEVLLPSVCLLKAGNAIPWLLWAMSTHLPYITTLAICIAENAYLLRLLLPRSWWDELQEMGVSGLCSANGRSISYGVLDHFCFASAIRALMAAFTKSKCVILSFILARRYAFSRACSIKCVGSFLYYFLVLRAAV